MKSNRRKPKTGPRIQPQAKVKTVTCSFRTDKGTYDQLLAYAAFISSDRSYVIRESLQILFRYDRSFKSHLHEREQRKRNKEPGISAFRIQAELS